MIKLVIPDQLLKISVRSGQKGRQYACEGYTHNIICRLSSVVNEENVKIEAKAHLVLQALQVLTDHRKDKIKIYSNIMFEMWF